MNLWMCGLGIWVENMYKWCKYNASEENKISFIWEGGAMGAPCEAQTTPKSPPKQSATCKKREVGISVNRLLPNDACSIMNRHQIKSDSIKIVA